MLSFEENTEEFLIPTEEEVNGAITKSIRNVMTIVCPSPFSVHEAHTAYTNLQPFSHYKVKAVNKLKSLRIRNAERRKPIASISESTELPGPDPQSVDECCTGAHATVITGVHSATETEKPVVVVASPPKRMDSAVALEDTKDCIDDSDKESERGKRTKDEGGHALPLPIEESIALLNIEVDGDRKKQEEFVVTESPTGIPENIYEEAYGKAIGLKEVTSEPIPNLVLE